MFHLQNGGIDSFSCSGDVEYKQTITSVSLFIASMSVKTLGMVRDAENPF